MHKTNLEENIMNESKIVIDDKTQKMLEVNEKKVVEDNTRGFRVKERYVVIKLGNTEEEEVNVLDVLMTNNIKYRIVEIVEPEE